MKKMRNEKEMGITLITLAVTIIIMLILATVSVNAVFGDNGIIKKVKQAKEMYSNSIVKDNEEIETLLNEMAVNREGKKDEISDLTNNWDLTKVNKVKSEDNVVIPVPKGYTASTVAGEKSVSTGFVIKEGNDGSKTEGINEFVWVPVADISDIYDEVNKAGQLWDFGSYSSAEGRFIAKSPAEKITYSATGYREPDVVTAANSGSDSASGSHYDASSSNLQQAGLSSTATASDFKAQLQMEFDEMINSVKTYGGFYIGRYETGNLSNSTKAVVQKNNSDIANQTWYTMYKMCKTIKVNENVYTGMIWGCQWDATLRWMQTSTNSEVANFPTNSEGKGNYSGKLILTGSNSSYAVNNIYDMAGNVFDWTLDVGGVNIHVFHGGYYGYLASSYPASIRDSGDAERAFKYLGCRATLYVK